MVLTRFGLCRCLDLVELSDRNDIKVKILTLKKRMKIKGARESKKKAESYAREQWVNMKGKR